MAFQERERSALPPGSRRWWRPGADGEDETDADHDPFGRLSPVTAGLAVETT
jgi:hypothetical protein